ncbi:MAG: 50S ribosomal protein L15 [Planctomycetia bacterium]
MRLNDVNRGVNKNKKRLRVGRGPGSGRGKTSGRGHKGQGQLAGWSAPAIFEGGRSPLIRRIPKRGFHNSHAPTVVSVNVAVLEAIFASGAEVTPETLRAAGACKGIWDQVKILGEGALTKPLKVSAHRFSAQAREKILAAGGSVTEIPGPAPVTRAKSRKAAKKTSPKRPAAG